MRETPNKYGLFAGRLPALSALKGGLLLALILVQA
ncbi:MAG: hypothetical protein ACJAR9_000419 [Celeribacter sp.]|jgi:hypothetical protein